MITLNDIYEAEKKERYSESLQNLPKHFVKEVSDYLRDKKEISSKNDESFSEVILKTKKQLENARTIFNSFIRLRRKKILNLVNIAAEIGISKKDYENMLDFEKELFESIMKCVDFSTKTLLGSLDGKTNEARKNEMIVFKENSDEFLGMNGEKMGPFEKGQIVNLPKEIAEILIEDKKAERI